MVSQKKKWQVFYSNEHKHVEKNISLKIYFYLKNNKNYIRDICI
jgi:hypothetical protein